MKGALMVCGTASDVGKTHVVTALCRALHRQGVRVAPFKAQNMALNSAVTPGGYEIGRAQAVQARAAGVDAEVAMNPVLLKPTGERTSQVMVMGRPLDQAETGHLDAAAYQAAKPGLSAVVEEALADLRRRFDVVILEGAGSPAEINLLPTDIVNLRLAATAGVPAVVVGDIDRGGVFAALYGTVALLPDDLRPLVRGFVINKFRGDPALLGDGLADLERRCGVPTLGVLPYVHDVALDAEDSLALGGRRPAAAGPARGESLDVAAIRFPRIANFTDLDALATEPGVGVRLVEHPGQLGDPDLVVLGGTKATVADLEWLRGRGFERPLTAARSRGSVILGVCGGYQMLGRVIVDDHESCQGEVEGLGWLDVATEFGATKVTRQRRGLALSQRVSGYQIHHGRVSRGAGAKAWLVLDDAYGQEGEGAMATGDDGHGLVLGTTLHGLFDEDGFRTAFLVEVARLRGRAFVPAGTCFAAAREAQIDRLADVVESHLDMGAVEALITEAGSLPADQETQEGAAG
ncbi:MAG: cobyric acid synthase [Acidimicrobiales bacterium]